MRVLHVSQPTTAGVATVVCNLVEEQVARGWQVAVACPLEGWLPAAVSRLGAKHLVWPSVRSPLRGIMCEGRIIRAAVSEFSPLVVHLHSAKAGLSGRLAIKGRVPTVYQPHAWSFHAAGRSRPLAVLWERAAGRWTDLILAVSPEEAQEGIAAGIAGRYEVVPNGVNLALWGAQSREDARARLGRKGRPMVVCVGRLAPQKGQDRLLRSWPIVRQLVPDAELVLVGDGPSRAELERDAPGGVVFAGESRTVGTWLSAADVVVLPSRWEGGSLALLEAMAAGRPVVAARVAGVESTLPPACGAIVDQDDDEQFARELARRLLDPDMRCREGRAARAWVEEHFDAKTLACRLSSLYDSIL